MPPLMVLSQASPVVYDPVLYRIEFATGIHPRYFVEMLNACASRFEGFCIFVYANLPLMVIMAARAITQ